MYLNNAIYVNWINLAEDDNSFKHGDEALYTIKDGLTE